MTADPGTALPRSPHDRWALGAVCAVLFLTFLDTTVVSVALSDVQSKLHAGVTQLQWVVNGYTLTFAALMMIAGALSDRFGRKRLMLLGLAIFGAGSLLGALAPNPTVLIAARVVMGVGAAASEPGTLSVIRHLYPDREDRARALGAWAAVSGLALALGPVIGGARVGVGTWRAVFWFNLVAVVAVVAAAAVAVPESADPQSARLDFPGFVTSAAGTGALSFAVILGETHGYRSSVVVALFALGVVSLVAFTRVERASRAPVLDLAYFREAPFSGSLAVVFVLFFGIFSIFFFTALYLAEVVGYSPYRVALEFLPMTAAMIGAAGLAGRRVAMQGPRLIMAEGCVLAGAGILLSEALRMADGHAGSGRLRLRHQRGAGHFGGPRHRPARALGHGGGGDQHQPRAGRRVRCGRPRGSGERPPHLRPHPPPAGAQDPGQLHLHRHRRR
jgi:MFS family permease